ncbi:lipocalin family protein [uncultured Bacteroides sp.]|uniref:lipocalin family protein n=1 Tax=uncultured Bacteroides sp. TaxID=162156 RepID=UPI00262E810A|nr:lipocalin family protein [uncultured Bacteroides sp.]
MKKFKLLFLLGLLSVMALSISACSDDDEGVGSASDLVGVWELVSYEYWEKEDGEITYERVENDRDERIEFKADGTWREAWMYNGKWDWFDEEEGDTWNYKNGTIIRSFIEDGRICSDEFHVKELTATNLVVEWYEKETYDGVVYEEWERYEYRKVSD